MNTKDIVRRDHPNAACVRQTQPGIAPFLVFRNRRSLMILGRGDTAEDAWNDAAKHPSVAPPPSSALPLTEIEALRKENRELKEALAQRDFTIKQIAALLKD